MSDKMIEELRLWRKFLPKSITKWEAFEVAKFDEIMSRHEATEPKDCGFTLATCPYERCSGITMRNPRATEPLAVLMKKKDYSDMRVNVENKHYKWSIEFRGYSPYKEITGDTYPSCEAKARAFLMGLPDKGDTK